MSSIGRLTFAIEEPGPRLLIVHEYETGPMIFCLLYFEDPITEERPNLSRRLTGQMVVNRESWEEFKRVAERKGIRFLPKF